MDRVGDLLHDWFGAIDGDEITTAQMVLRGLVVYIAVVIIIRLGKKRSLGKATAFDILLIVMLGAIAGRAVSGGAPVVPSLATCAAMVALHWLFSRATIHWHGLGGIIKGHPHVIVRNGKIDEEAMHRCHLSMRDLEEELRHHNVSSLDKVVEARLERSGSISVLTTKD